VNAAATRDAGGTSNLRARKAGRPLDCRYRATWSGRRHSA